MINNRSHCSYFSLVIYDIHNIFTHLLANGHERSCEQVVFIPCSTLLEHRDHKKNTQLLTVSAIEYIVSCDLPKVVDVIVGENRDKKGIRLNTSAWPTHHRIIYPLFGLLTNIYAKPQNNIVGIMSLLCFWVCAVWNAQSAKASPSHIAFYSVFCFGFRHCEHIFCDRFFFGAIHHLRVLWRLVRDQTRNVERERDRWKRPISHSLPLSIFKYHHMLNIRTRLLLMQTSRMCIIRKNRPLISESKSRHPAWNLNICELNTTHNRTVSQQCASGPTKIKRMNHWQDHFFVCSKLHDIFHNFIPLSGLCRRWDFHTTHGKTNECHWIHREVGKFH